MSRNKRKDSKKHSNKKSNLTPLIKRLFDKNPMKVLSHKQVCDELSINDKELRKSVFRILTDLMESDYLREVGHDLYKKNQLSKVYEGEIEITANGSGYVIVDGMEKDIFVHPKNINNALNGDVVRVILNKRSTQKRPEGEVVEVLKRQRTQFVGTLEVHDNYAFFVSDNPRNKIDIYIPKEKLNGAQNKDKVLVRITAWPENKEKPYGEVVELLKSNSANDNEALNILVNHGIDYKFPVSVLAQAERVGMDLDQEEIKNRRDFRDVLTFTIDPKDAKDFDDAISYKDLGNGKYEVGVHIADVSYYVTPGSALDQEALKRSNSTYLIDRVVPMLPEQLSNMACSLRPQEEKFTFSAVFDIDENGVISKEWFGKTVICSNRRMTYEQAQEIIEGKSDEMEKEILFLDKIAKIYRKKRMDKGAISFSSEEMRFELDAQGNPTTTYLKVQKDAHKLIEEFMLLANRKVAEFIGKRNKGETIIPFIYRVHDKPSMEKIQLFLTFIDKFGYDLDISDMTQIAPALNQLLDDIRYKNEFPIISQMAIRSMAKAVYSTKNIGHFGLGFQFYTHFTSPIRRYADLMVHRILQEELTTKKHKYGSELDEICKLISKNERNSIDAERESEKYFETLFLRDKVGEVFEGTISGLADFGIFVRLNDNQCEGMVALSEIPGDRFYFDADHYEVIGSRNKEKFNFGDAVKVRVKQVDTRRKQIDMDLV